MCLLRSCFFRKEQEIEQLVDLSTISKIESDSVLKRNFKIPKYITDYEDKSDQVTELCPRQTREYLSYHGS